MMLVRLLRALVLLALLVVLARSLAGSSGVALDVAAVRDVIGEVLQRIEQTIEQVR